LRRRCGAWRISYARRGDYARRWSAARWKSRGVRLVLSPHMYAEGATLAKPPQTLDVRQRFAVHAHNNAADAPSPPPRTSSHTASVIEMRELHFVNYMVLSRGAGSSADHPRTTSRLAKEPFQNIRLRVVASVASKSGSNRDWSTMHVCCRTCAAQHMGRLSLSDYF
jgi:hypothetical protein